MKEEELKLNELKEDDDDYNSDDDYLELDLYEKTYKKTSKKSFKKRK